MRKTLLTAFIVLLLAGAAFPNSITVVGQPTSGAAPPTIPAATAHWYLENNVTSETSHNGTATAGFSYYSADKIQGTYAGTFDVNDYFYVADHADFEVGSGDWSFSAWVQSVYLTGTQALFGKYVWDSGRHGIRAIFDDTDADDLKLSYMINGTLTTIDTNWHPTISTWYLITIAFDASEANEVQIWVSSSTGTFGDQINGTQYALNVTAPDTTGDFTVGFCGASIDDYQFYGIMDDIRWWKGTVLTSTQAQALYDLY